jgi:hypothetical protein
MSFLTVFKHPSAYVPAGMSLAALAILVGYVVLFGTAKQEDEGTAAHLFQLLMAGQAPIMGFFALKWVPRAPVPAIQVMALQICAALVPMGLLFYLEF